MCSVVTRAELGLHPADQPKASVLFLGPTGVGKTELTKQIAKFIFGKELLYRFDMSEFLHLDQVQLFVGDETGQTGRLGTVLSEHSQGILLFDEIEKAHKLIWDLFLQMIGDARITLADHKTYDLIRLWCSCETSMTTNETDQSAADKVQRTAFRDLLEAAKGVIAGFDSGVFMRNVDQEGLHCGSKATSSPSRTKSPRVRQARRRPWGKRLLSTFSLRENSVTA
jgi:ATP-dependent Clp protease ATP-binding subunit ClpB